MSATAKWTVALMVACVLALLVPAVSQIREDREHDRLVCQSFARMTGTECNR